MQSEGCDWSTSAQKAAVRLTHQPVALPQGILGKKLQCSGVSEEQRQPEALSYRQKLLHGLLQKPDRAGSERLTDRLTEKLIEANSEAIREG